MMSSDLFSGVIRTLEKSLDLRVNNQKIIASNIANNETPGYAPLRMDFQASLKNAMAQNTPLKTSHPSHFFIGQNKGDGSAPVVARQLQGTSIGDQNGVNLDEEMIAMAENQILYETTTRLVSKKLALLKYVAQDGK